jgi:flagellar L-ring protein precursor FlgH
VKLPIVAALVVALAVAKDKKAEPSAVDRYIAEAEARGAERKASAGSLFSAGAPWSDLPRDLRASQVDDLVTIVVSDRASAETTAGARSARKATASGGISSVFGKTTPALRSIGGLSSDQQMDGSGTTSRESSLSTTVSARVTHVLPNGYLVVEGAKEIVVNSERQQVTVRGVLRWNDLTAANTIRSDRLANLEIRVNGKGVVGDAVRRPNFLYRLLVGLMPF